MSRTERRTAPKALQGQNYLRPEGDGPVNWPTVKRLRIWAGRLFSSASATAKSSKEIQFFPSVAVKSWSLPRWNLAVRLPGTNKADGDRKVQLSPFSWPGRSRKAAPLRGKAAAYMGWRQGSPAGPEAEPAARPRGSPAQARPVRPWRVRLRPEARSPTARRRGRDRRKRISDWRRRRAGG